MVHPVFYEIIFENDLKNSIKDDKMVFWQGIAIYNFKKDLEKGIIRNKDKMTKHLIKNECAYHDKDGRLKVVQTEECKELKEKFEEIYLKSRNKWKKTV